jgi:exodeoxyribonuclease V gamma subunit
MLHLYFSNRFETLAQLLISRLGAGAAGIFTIPQVIVPSRAVERSLTLAIADQDGICANIGFDYLARWLWRQISRFVKGVGETSPFEPETLTWRIYRALGDQQFVAGHARLLTYLQGADDLMRYELALGLAALIRDYSTYREDWLEAWAEGREMGPLAEHADPTTIAHAQADERWQAALYRRIIAELKVDAGHPGFAFINEIRSRGVAGAIDAGLPACAHIFALPTMPPQHMRLIQLLGTLIDVHLYVLNPCQEYWFEVVDERRLQALAARGLDQYHETGNQLLANWGRQTQSHVGLLANLEGVVVSDDNLFERYAGASVLAQLQNSILELTALGAGAVTIAKDDRSLEVHVCHSLTRELEVLQDYLLDLFATDASLRPSGILVVTPDLEAAAPVIEAVFGTVPRERDIPYQLTGRARSTVNTPARTLLALLSLAASRFEATAVFDLLQQSMVARRFGLDDEDLQRIRGWIGVSGIRWALDARHCAQFDIPAHTRHTLSDGLERLFLGYALPGNVDEALFGYLLPAGNATGSDALALGAFWRFIEELRKFHATASIPQPITVWARCLTEAIANFLSASAAELDDLNDLLISLDKLSETLRQGGMDGPVPLAVIQAALEGLLDEAIHGGVPTGRVTFTSMAALRTLPFEVVCVIGLNDGAFPSTVRAPEYDLMALDPRRGDRQRALDERNVFLDLVLAARRRLYLSYCGRSVRDNSIMPPSVLMSELLAAVPVNPYLHPLQAFSAECFSSDSKRPLRSYNREMGEALRESMRAVATAPAIQPGGEDNESDEVEQPRDADDDDAAVVPQPLFFTAPLAVPGPEWRELTLDELARFFRNPSRFLLTRRLDIGLSYEPDELLDQEPFTLDSPGRRAIAARLLPRLIENPDDPDATGLLAAGTELPDGNMGAFERSSELASLREFAARVHGRTRAPTLAPRHSSIVLDLGGETWRLDAAFSDLRESGLVCWKYSRERDIDALRAAEALDAWLSHLVLCADPPPAVSLRTTAIARNGTWVFRPPEDPRAILAELLAVYRQGLAEPIHFFPKSSWKYCQEGHRISAARKEWRADDYRIFAESADPAYALAFRGQPEPLGDEFHRLASLVYDPLIAHVDKEGSVP